MNFTKEQLRVISEIESIVSEIEAIDKKRKTYQLRKKAINNDIRELRQLRDSISKKELGEVINPMKKIIIKLESLPNKNSL